MRAIDGDILEKKLKDAINMCMSIDTSGLSELKAVLEDVEEMPTIEPQRKKGRWIKKTIKKKIENDYSCSECGRHVSLMRGYDVRMVYPFCHCGADMTEGEG